MPETWIEILAADGSRRRHNLKPGLTTVGSRRADIEIEGAGNDQLHVWDQPPKLVFVGVGEAPRLNGQACEEAPLRPGDLVEWHGWRMQFGGVPHAVIVELHDESAHAVKPPESAPTASATSANVGETVAWRRLRAGMLVELGLADLPTARRWQEAVMRNEFDPDGCTRDVLAASTVAPDDSRLQERSARLLRDFVMAPVQLASRGPTKKTRNMAMNSIAFAITQFIVFGICCLFVFVALFILRARWNWSVDTFLDNIRGTLTGS